MLKSTLPHLKCPRKKKGNFLCEGSLRLDSAPAGDVVEIQDGQLQCVQCQSKFPILAGVAILVHDVGQYLFDHVKGITQLVPDSKIPAEFRRDFLEAKAEIQSEHIEEDLEAERVNALYLMNHYLRVRAEFPHSSEAWWRPKEGVESELIDHLVRNHWDDGPFAQIHRWVEKFGKVGVLGDTVELGCGVGGLASVLKPYIQFYLGVDSSFASIALARHLNLGVPYPRPIRIPGDLLDGSVSRPLNFPIPKSFDGSVDFVVGDLESAPLEKKKWDLVIALNAIDMLEDPTVLPKLQKALLKPHGIAIQSCPYIWHEQVAKNLRKIVPPQLKDSARAVEWLYERAGFKIEERIDHLPWLFFKHLRQLEIYSVHIFLAR